MQIIMDSLVNFKDLTMNKMALYIILILLREISSNEITNLFSNPVYLMSLLKIVDIQLQNPSEQDVVLDETLSVIRRLTEESPKCCEMLVEKRGLDLFFNVLNVRSHLISNHL